MSCRVGCLSVCAPGTLCHPLATSTRHPAVHPSTQISLLRCTGSCLHQVANCITTPDNNHHTKHTGIIVGCRYLPTNGSSLTCGPRRWHVRAVLEHSGPGHTHLCASIPRCIYTLEVLVSCIEQARHCDTYLNVEENSTSRRHGKVIATAM